MDISPSIKAIKVAVCSAVLGATQCRRIVNAEAKPKLVGFGARRLFFASTRRLVTAFVVDYAIAIRDSATDITVAEVTSKAIELGKGNSSIAQVFKASLAGGGVTATNMKPLVAPVVIPTTVFVGEGGKIVDPGWTPPTPRDKHEADYTTLIVVSIVSGVIVALLIIAACVWYVNSSAKMAEG